MSKKGDYQIPFDINGNPQHYPESWWDGAYPNRVSVGPDWRENKPFVDTLTYSGYGRGRSSAVLCFTGNNGTEYTMFLKDFDACALFMRGGQITGTWWFTKRGMNYGVQLKEPS